MAAPKDIRQSLERKRAALRREISSWEPTWKELARYLAPYLGYFEGDQRNEGNRRDDEIIDGSALRAISVFVSGLQSGLTSPARPWFRLTTTDQQLGKSKRVRSWLDDVQRIMFDIFSESNFYDELLRAYAELAVFGTASILISEDYDTVIRCRAYTAGEYAIGLNAERRVDTFYTLSRLSPRQMVGRFGIDAVSEAVREAYENDRGDDTYREVHFLIDPNDGKIPFLGMEDRPWRGIHWETTAEPGKLLEVAGFHEFPVPAPRWNATGRDVYGRGPGWDAIGDTKMLQKMQRDKLMALDKLVNPPMTGPSTLRRTGVNLLPGGMNYSDAMTTGDGLRPVYQLNPDLQAIEYSIEKTQQAIRSTFYNDLFLMLANSPRPQMTAREVAERFEEKLLMLGPILERTEGDLLSPTIERVFGIMERVGILPPPPEEVEGAPIQVEYISILAQAQRMVGTSAIEQFTSFVGTLAGVKPEVLDNYNADAAAAQYGEMLGIPADLMYDDEVVAEIRETRAKQQQQQQMAAMMQQGAQGVKTLSEADTGENNALGALLGGMGGGGAQ